MFDDNFFEALHDHHKQQQEEYERLKADIPKKVNKGDKAIVAVGLLGHGFKWIRQECEVLDVADTSIKIRLPDKKIIGDGYYEYWIDPALITDILPLKEIMESKEDEVSK